MRIYEVSVIKTNCAGEILSQGITRAAAEDDEDAIKRVKQKIRDGGVFPSPLGDDEKFYAFSPEVIAEQQTK